MQRFMLKSKIHRATVTDADLHYEGSISIDEKLLEEANILPYEKVAIYDVDNGERFTTYAIKGKRNSGVICLNGAAARKVAKGDLVIIASYVLVEEKNVKNWKPKCVFVDGKNKIKKIH
ncbi:MAG TPA: aspartate 1-decarboxylase [Smithella sp.]|nr:aspartate 1-decarboxylase [Smithella sp.]HRS98371.1 aspartate 1-decarboxylase [Smithella sp.]